MTMQYVWMMGIFIALNFFVAFASAGILGEAELESRITNGEVAARGQFPYQVGLLINMKKNNGWCGGTLISDRWILTAAHCTLDALGVTAYLGATDILNDTEKGQQRIYTSKANIIVHAHYNPKRLLHDISLIKLPVVVEFNEFIKPAALPKESEKYSTYEGEMVWASGWGKESDSANSTSQYLRYIQVPVLKTSTCRYYYPGVVTTSMLCVKTKGKRSTCNGDSGGPLVYKTNGVNTVIGATSFGMALGCEKGWPGVFTRITDYLDWIQEISGVVNK